MSASALVEIAVETRARTQWVEVTAELQRVAQASGIVEGVLVALCLHTTAGLTINENADPDVAADAQARLQALAPEQAGYRHGEGNSDAHIKSALIGQSVAVPVSAGRLVLGTWQGIYFCEFDGPRSRKIAVRIMG